MSTPLESENKPTESSVPPREEMHTLAGWYLKKHIEKGGSLFIPSLGIKLLANGDVVEVNSDGSPKELTPHT